MGSEVRLEEIGWVKGFFAQPSVAVIDLKNPIKIGDILYIKGHTTDFQQVVASLHVNHEAVSEGYPGQSVGLKVMDRCRKHDVVYKLITA